MFACTLTESEMPDRLTQLAALGQRLLSAEDLGSRAALRFRADADTRARVDAFVAAESVCCAFLSIDVRDEDGCVLVTIAGPDGAEPIVADLVAAFEGAR
jgi:hypothetical protein